MFEDVLAFDLSVRHIRYLVSMIRNVAMVGAKHVVHMYENRPGRPDPLLNPADVHAWQKHSYRYNQVVIEFRKIVMETPAVFHRITPVTTDGREQVDMNEITQRLGLTLRLTEVDETHTNFALLTLTL